ncbi:MAG: DNA alkylation repair protein [Christensenellales bacterium]|jgi:3-methyladenine DNA glycosylase AlkD
MNLIKQSWDKKDKDEFENFLSFQKKPQEKIDWTRRILQTSKPVYALTSKEMSNIAKQILQGNAESFLNLKCFSSYESTIIYIAVLNSLFSEFDTYLPYFEIYLKNIDCWAHTDSVNFDKLAKHKQKILNLSDKLLQSNSMIERRMALIILLKFCSDEQVALKTFETLNKLPFETEYYVNMAGAWLLCECFVKHRNLTAKYFETHKTNKQIINLAIQKCRDSFRVSKEDKEWLLQFKMKK